MIHENIEALIDGGAGAVQLRAKAGFDEVQTRRALADVGSRSRDEGVALILNDDLHLALRLARDDLVRGVHLGQDDLRRYDSRTLRTQTRDAGLWLGVSTHDSAQVHSALALEPDYLGFGPVYPTGSKSNPDPTVGVAALRRAALAAGTTPVVAIGGIDGSRARACLEAGAAAACSWCCEETRGFGARPPPGSDTYAGNHS